MAEEEIKENEETALEGEEGEGQEGESPPKKKKLILIIIVVILLLGGGGAALYFAGMLPIGGNSSDKEIDPKLVPKIIYHDLEEFIVNLNNPGKQVSFLKMRITLELPNLLTKTIIESKLPRIRDNFQLYLRELRNSDLQGSSGIHRLKEELILRINKVIAPEKVSDILFEEIIVQ